MSEQYAAYLRTEAEVQGLMRLELVAIGLAAVMMLAPLAAALL